MLHFAAERGWGADVVALHPSSLEQRDEERLQDLPEGVAREWGRKLLFAVFLNLMLSFAPGISLEAHLGGGFAGAALAYWLDRRRAPNRWLGALGIGLALTAMLGGLYLTMRYSDEWKPLREVHAARLAIAEFLKKTDGH